MMQSFLMIIQN